MQISSSTLISICIISGAQTWNKDRLLELFSNIYLTLAYFNSFQLLILLLICVRRKILLTVLNWGKRNRHHSHSIYRWNICSLALVIQIFRKIGGCFYRFPRGFRPYYKYEKSTSIGLNIRRDEVKKEAATFGCREEILPFTYLEMPLGDNPMKVSFQDSVVDKIRKRLAKWRGLPISKGGQLTLVNSVFPTIPLYFLSIFKIPSKVSTSIDKIVRDFLWEGANKGGSHLVNWCKVTAPQIMGVWEWVIWEDQLCFQNQRKNFCLALLSKWLWRFVKKDPALWKKIIDRIANIDIPKTAGSQTVLRKSLILAPVSTSAKRRSFVESHVNSKLGNREKIRFWEDNWATARPFCVEFPAIYAIAN